MQNSFSEPVQKSCKSVLTRLTAKGNLHLDPRFKISTTQSPRSELCTSFYFRRFTLLSLY
ncbi:unnamed protein product [Hymenolepis diminuta]|uniref:Uncharacterized protein n=1 Tax=Hymenolepis diminuta TaxID=6216 RepID=A0A564Y0I3_HYMDI|nr:unnamed protein product [Hymenolepis diminuta]